MSITQTGAPASREQLVPGPFRGVPLRYPTEPSRFAVALVAAGFVLVVLAVALISAGVAALFGGVLTISLLLASTWSVIQVRRAKLLGNSVRVTPTSFPELYTMMDELRRRLDYRRRIEMYVTDKSDSPVSMITYLGTHIILIEGGLASELPENDKRAEIRFLLARHVGSLKAKHSRLDVLLIILAAAKALQFVKPFVLPYYRATVYTGDQIGLACCGSLDSALAATGRLLVGKESASTMPLGAVLHQATLIHEQFLPRLAEFSLAAPHTVNRYVNLLMYGRLADPAAWERLLASLSPPEQYELQELWLASPHRRQAGGFGEMTTPGVPTSTATPVEAAPSMMPTPPAMPAPTFPAPDVRASATPNEDLNFPPPEYPPPEVKLHEPY